jgi:hypothetical protein
MKNTIAASVWAPYWLAVALNGALYQEYCAKTGGEHRPQVMSSGLRVAFEQAGGACAATVSPCGGVLRSGSYQLPNPAAYGAAPPPALA